MKRLKTGSAAWDLKTTELSCEAEVMRDWLDMRRLAVVSTGWKTMSSAIPAQPVHRELDDGRYTSVVLIVYLRQ